MRNAVYQYLQDLLAGDPVALGLTLFFLLLLAVAAIIWIVDLVKRKKEKKKPRGH